MQLFIKFKLSLYFLFADQSHNLGVLKKSDPTSNYCKKAPASFFRKQSPGECRMGSNCLFDLVCVCKHGG